MFNDTNHQLTRVLSQTPCPAPSRLFKCESPEQGGCQTGIQIRVQLDQHRWAASPENPTHNGWNLCLYHAREALSCFEQIGGVEFVLLNVPELEANALTRLGAAQIEANTYAWGGAYDNGQFRGERHLQY